MTEQEKAAARRRRAELAARKRFKLDPHQPTAETRRMCWCMAAAGVDEEGIAFAFKIPLDQLKRIYSEELRWGIAKASSQVIGALFQAATNSRHPQFAQSAKFWLQAKAGWSEKVSVNANIKQDIEALRHADEATLIELGRRCLEGAGPAGAAGKLH